MWDSTVVRRTDEDSLTHEVKAKVDLDGQQTRTVLRLGYVLASFNPRSGVLPTGDAATHHNLEISMPGLGAPPADALPAAGSGDAGKGAPKTKKEKTSLQLANLKVKDANAKITEIKAMQVKINNTTDMPLGWIDVNTSPSRSSTP